MMAGGGRALRDDRDEGSTSVADTGPTSAPQGGAAPVQGQSADGQPPGQQAPPEERRSRPWWQTALAIALLALLVGVAAYAAYALLGRGDVPDVVGLTLTSAEVEIERAGFEVGAVVGLTSSAPTHTVTAQHPPAETSMSRGGVVDLDVVPETDWIKPPDLVGLSGEQAEQTVLDYDLTPLPIQAFGKDTAVGVVAGQLPEENVPMRPEAELAYVLGLGGRTTGIEVPQVATKPVDQAVAELEALGFVPEVLPGPLTAGPPGVVAEQLPLPGWFAVEGSPVALLVPTE
jgi:beta-lactam-binding protein with PASTA domain